MAEVAGFDAFYRAVNRGRDPFPWQRRLAQRVEEGSWPPEIGIGTGLGKTSCLDVAVWALARQAHRPPPERAAPTRIWWVVNRRLLVDSAHDHGIHLAGLLSDPSQAAEAAGPGAVEALESVAGALRTLAGGAGAQPLHVTRLRGGAELGARPPDPSQPSLIFATVAMFASRWLFRGFGTSASMRPVDAALAGIDSLVLLDEAHLARPLQRLAEPLAQCDVGDPSVLIGPARSRPVIVSLTATGDDPAAFGLDAEDQAHPVIRSRLGATKPTRLVEVRERELAEALARTTLALLSGRPPSAAVVFVNAPGLARSVFERLRADPTLGRSGADLELLTGRMRDREADAVRSRVLDPARGAPAGRRDRSARSRHLVVVATQTLEVGADLDFDVLVTEACGTRALIQRSGRLNRLGEIADARAAVVFAGDAKGFGIYKEEPRALWARLQEVAAGGKVDLGPGRIGGVLGPADDLPERVGEILPAHLWEWAKTTTPPPGEAPPELFFAGFETDLARVSVAWRAWIPEDGGELRPPLSSAEAVEVPLWEAAKALGELTGGELTRLRPDRVSVERFVPTEALRAGDQVILPTFAGGYDDHGWAPGVRDGVFDVSLLRPPGIPLVPEAIRCLVTSGPARDAALALVAQLAEPPDPAEDIERAALAAELVRHLGDAGPSGDLSPEEWEGLVARLRPEIEYPVEGGAWLIYQRPAQRRPEAELRADAFDELSFTATSAGLHDHLGSVGEMAARIGRAIGLDPSLVSALEAAGRFHDLGKADVRFQRWLDPAGVAGGPVAKSARPWFYWQRDRIAAGWPQGGRHEELSRRLLVSWLQGRQVDWDPDLVVHLVVSHHGYGRPLVPAPRDEAPVLVQAELQGESVAASGDLSVTDWDQPARFHRCCERYGYWGLALLEAVVRQADHQLSAAVVA